MAFIPIQFPVTNMTPDKTVITNDTEIPQALFIRLMEITELDNSELTQSENNENGNEVAERKQDREDNERGVFISIGSLVFLGIFLLLPSTKTFY